MNGTVSQTSYTYDQYNNVTDEKDYDWGSGSPGGVLRDTRMVYVTSSSNYNYPAVNMLGLPPAIWVYDGASNLYGFTQYSYDEYGKPATLYNCPGIIGHDNVNFGGAGPRGNATTVGVRLTSNNTWLNTTRSCDIADNPIKC